jgi:hypothetical protein
VKTSVNRGPRVASPEARLLLACAAVELDEARRSSVLALLDGPLDWDLVITGASRHRILLLLRAHLDALRAPLPVDAHRRMTTIANQQVARNLALVGELLRVLGLLDRGGITAATIKGPTLALLLYGGLNLRPFIDIDVVVRPEEGSAARQVLLDAGYRFLTPHPESRREAFVAAGKSLDFLSPIGHTVDLHWALFDRYLGISRQWQERAFERLQDVKIGGRTVETFAPEDLALFLAVHGGMHEWASLGWLVDLERLVARYPDLNWDAVGVTARRLHMERLLLVGFALMEALLEGACPPPIRARLLADETADRTALRIEARVRDSLRTRPRKSTGLVRPNRVRLRERAGDRVREVLSLSFTPTLEDWKVVRFPERVAWAYYLVRPVRLTGKYTRLGIRTAIRRLGVRR